MLKNSIKYIMLCCLLPLAFTACEEKEEIGEYTEIGDANGVNHKYVISYWATDYAQYLLAINSLDELMSGEINMRGRGIEQGGNMIPVANRFFACTTDADGGRSYHLDVNGKLNTRGREDRIYLESCYAYGNTSDDKTLIIGASWNGTTADNEILLYDPLQVSYVNRKFHSFGMKGKNGENLIQWPTDILASGEYAYVSYYPRTASTPWVMPITDTAYIKVLKYPSLEYVTTIKDVRTSPIGMYYANTSLIKTDNGDVYSFSSNAYAAGFVPGDKPSGILRIKKGSTEFDKDYFINIETSILQGKVISAYHTEGNKVVVVYIPNDKDNADGNWAFTSTKTLFKSAVIDLGTQTILPVTGLPDHTGDYFYGYASLYAENGKAYKSYLTGNEARVYEIDLTTGEAKAGAIITGGQYLPVISRLNY